MRPSDPWWIELRPKGHKQQHAKGPDPVNRATQCSLSALLRVKIERGIPAIIRQRQHYQCGVLNRSRGLGQQSVELFEPRPWRVVERQSGGTPHLADDREKRTVGVLRRAEITQ